jgi:hypothetical protein
VSSPCALASVAWLICACAPATPSTLANVAAPPAGPPTIVVQLDLRASFLIGPPFSQPPPFTLLDDGTLIRLATDGSAVLETRLPTAEVRRIVDHILALGFERLRSHTESCKSFGDGRGVCVSDDATTILRVALPTGELREVETYADFSNEPAVFDSIVAYLKTDRQPRGTRYVPRAAVIHVQSSATRPRECQPIDLALLARPPGRTRWTAQLTDHALRALLDQLPSNIGHFVRCHGDSSYGITLVPAVPGSDLSRELPLSE